MNVWRAAAGFVLAGAAGMCSGTGQAPASAPFSQVLATLVEEARQSQREQRLARHQPSIAAELSLSLPARELGERLLRRQHEHDFVDAYVRWQLTSYEPSFQGLSEDAWLRGIASLPALEPNPRGTTAVVQAIQQAAAKGVLSEAEQHRLSNALERLAAESSRAAAMNVPAEALRAWLRDRVPQRGQASCAAAMELLAARLAASWPDDDARQALEQALERTSTNRRFTPGDRRSLLRAAQALVGPGRPIVASARIRDGAVEVAFTTFAVNDADLKRWARLLDPYSGEESGSQAPK